MTEHNISLTGAQIAMIREALVTAADSDEDIDSPIHYTKDDLHRIFLKASGMRALSEWLADPGGEGPGPCVECGSQCYAADDLSVPCSNPDCIQHMPLEQDWIVRVETTQTVTATSEDAARRAVFGRLAGMSEADLLGACTTEVDPADDEVEVK